MPHASAETLGATSFNDIDTWNGDVVGTGVPTSAEMQLDYDKGIGKRISNGYVDSTTKAALYPIESKIDGVAQAPRESAYLLMRAFDVDEYDGSSGTGEWDRVYLSEDPALLRLGNPYTAWPTSGTFWSGKTADYKKEFPQQTYVGALSGNNEKWNTTVMKLDASKIQANEPYYYGVSTHHYVNAASSGSTPNWEVIVDWAQLIVDGGAKESGAIDKGDISVEKGGITVDTSFVPKQNGNFAMEVSVVKPAASKTEVDQNLDTKKKLFSGAEANVQQPWSGVQLVDPSIDPAKEYDVNVILFDDRGDGKVGESYTNPGKAQHIYTVSTFDPKLRDFATSVAQYDATALDPNEFKENYLKINGAANGAHLDKVRIVTLPDSSAGRLVLQSASGVTTDIAAGSEISAADLPKLKFVPAEGGFDGSASFEWNGYDGDEYAVYPGKVMLTANHAPRLDPILIEANKGETVPLPQSIFDEAYSDGKSGPPSKLRFDTLPDPSKGRLVLDGGSSSAPIDVQPGGELDASELSALRFVPAEGFTGTEEFRWNGYDGTQYALKSGSLTIRVNAPPAAGHVGKSGSAGDAVSFGRDDFSLTPAYTDPENDKLTKIRITLPEDFSVKQGELSYTTVTGNVYLPSGARTEIAADELDTLRFMPSAGLPNGGTAIFDWEAYDGKMYSEVPGTVSIAYSGVPSGDAVGVGAEEGAPSIPVTLRGSDPETVTGLVYGIASQPLKGTLTPADPADPNGANWTYVPNPDFIGGTDTFTYTVKDADGQESAPATVTVRIDRTLDGWPGDKERGDTRPAKAIPGQSLKLSAVSSLLAEGVNAKVGGEEVPLLLANASTFAQDGYKQWEKSTYPLDARTLPGRYSVAYTAVGSEGMILPAEPETRLADNGFEVLAVDLTLTADPAAIVGDGTSRTELTALLKDAEGVPVQGVEVSFDSGGIGSFPNGDRAVTGADGKATLTYQSANITGVEEQSFPVKATVNDPVRGLWGQKEIRVVFLPASVKGVLTEGKNNTPVVGATVRITLDVDGNGSIEPGVDFDRTVNTDTHGAYSVPVPFGGREYTLTVTRLIEVGGVPTPVTYEQKAQVGMAGTTEEEVYESQKTAAGIVMFKRPDGSSSLIDNAFIAHTSVYLQDASGHYVTENGSPKSFSLGKQGVFSAPGLTIGDYKLEIRYELEPGKAITIGTSTVHVQANGEMNISQELVDPYGTIRDASTKALIEGATVTLYYADTAKNRGSGVAPNTKVVLPAIPGFAPNDNASPVQLSDVNGFYAYMVYPETDYYLIVTQKGYDTYTSPTLSVGQEIVRHDLELTPQRSGSPAAVATTEPVQAPQLELKLTVDRNPVEEGGQSTIKVDYKNVSGVTLGEGTIRVALPAGAEVIDAAGGTRSGGSLVWTVRNLDGGKSGSYNIVLKWPMQQGPESSYPVTGSFAAGASQAGAQAAAQSNVNVRVLSPRFEKLRHQRYILGYPDGEFKPDRSLTRAELAAIVARLTENVNLNDPIGFRDVPTSHWAANYIRIAVKHDYFDGFRDGTFKPESQVTRAELAAVAVRFLGLEGSAASGSTFTDTKGHWASSAIERLSQDGFIAGYPDGSFRPNQVLKRSEAVTLINRMLSRGPLTGLKPQFPDMPQTHWAFGDVQEATISHTAKRGASGEIWTGTLADDVQ